MSKHQLGLSILAALLAATPAFASTSSEVEQNDSIAAAQYLTIGDRNMNVSAVLGTVGAGETVTMRGVSFTQLSPTADLDFFSFYAQAGDVVTLDVDNGIGGQQSVDTILAVFDSAGTMLRMNDDAATADAGSESTLDSRIEKFVIPVSGVYHAGVSGYPRFFQDGGNVSSSSGGAGDYNLIVTGVSPAVKQITIDVKPGSSDLAPINPKSKGKIPVALLSGVAFNAMDIDPATVTFGVSGRESSLSKCGSSGQDVNGDGLLDLVCHFENQAAGFDYDSVEGIARGKTRDGMAFEGRGLLKVVPTKTK